MRARDLAAREVLAAHLRRIDEANPAVNAIVTLVPELAAAEAAAADESLARGEEVGPLHGLPIAIKDLVATAGIRTTFGSPIFADHVPETDDLLVTRIRAAGAIVLGKTNTPEWGAGSHTFNPVFGTTVNPYDPSRTAGGSSGGAAAALALGMIPIADGSDLGGSLRNPAAFCGVVGFRPSPGRVPSWPTDDPEDDQSVDGPMGRSVEDAALLLSAIAGPDPRVPDLPPRAGGGVRAAARRRRRGHAGRVLAVGRRRDAVRPCDRPRGRGRRTDPGGDRVPARRRFPDLAGARDAFLTLRARSYAAVARRHARDRPGPDEGDRRVERRSRAGAHPGRRRACRDGDAGDPPPGRRLPRRRRLHRDAGHAGAAVRRVDRVPHRDRGRRDAHLPRLDGLVLDDHRHRAPRDLGAVRHDR